MCILLFVTHNCCTTTATPAAPANACNPANGWGAAVTPAVVGVWVRWQL